jgi:type IV secretion system protein VirD4
MLTDSLPTDSLLLGISNFSRILHVRSTKKRRELGNCLVVAPTRGGKGLLAVSQLLTWRSSCVVNDIKGELHDQTAGFRATLGKVYVLDPRGYGHQYDPLQGRDTEDELYGCAKHLLYEPNEADGLAFTQRATKMLTLLFLAARELNRLAGEVKYRLLPFVRHMADLGLNSVAPTIHAISPTIARRLLDGEYTPDKDYDENKFLSSSWESLTARLYPLLTEKIVRCFAGSDFTGKELITAKEPVTTVYLHWPESDVLAKRPLITLVWESLIQEMINTYDSSKREDCRPVLLLIDEAANSPIPNLHQYASTLAGRGISVWAAYQDLSQIDGLYGKHKANTIKNNMDSKIFYRQASLETAEYVERFLGRRSGYAHSQTLHEGEETSEGLSEHAIPLLTSQDINQLGHDEIIGWHSNRKPFRARRMDWRAFSILKQRRAIPPPQLSALPQLEESLLPSPWRRGERWPLTPIDPDAIN